MEVNDVNDLAAVKERLGVPGKVEACHTAVIGGYIVEGHVPAEAIRRMLRDRPDIVGIAVPGMPVGAPGMGGSPREAYNVVTWDKAGQTAVYERHP